jgi:hypothetical protein
MRTGAGPVEMAPFTAIILTIKDSLASTTTAPCPTVVLTSKSNVLRRLIERDEVFFELLAASACWSLGTKRVGFYSSSLCLIHRPLAIKARV